MSQFAPFKALLYSLGDPDVCFPQVSKGIGDRDANGKIVRRTVEADPDHRFKIESLREPARQSKRQAIGVLAAQNSVSEAGTPGKRAGQ